MKVNRAALALALALGLLWAPLAEAQQAVKTYRVGLVPGLSRVACLGEQDASLLDAGRILGVQVQFLEVNGPKNLNSASEVLVSSTVKDLVAGSGLRFQDRGVHALKGVPGEWRLYALERGSA